MTSSPFAEELVALLPRLRRFARALCGDAAVADDLVQAACERGLKGQDGWQPGTRLDAWMFRIVRNLWIDGIRRRRTEGVTEDVDEAIGLAGSDGRRVAHASIAVGAAMAAVAELPEDQRRLITLVCIEEASYREAAETLGVPIGTVMSRLCRARKALAARLGLEEGESPIEAAGGF